MPRIVTLGVLLALTASFCQAEVVINESDFGDFSDSPIAPTPFGTLELGNTVVNGIIESVDFKQDADIFTFTVAAGHRLDAILLNSLDEDRHFFAFDEGNSNNPATGRDFLLARLIGGTDINSDILGPVPAGLNYGSPESAAGISPVGPGEYSVWMRETNEGVFGFSLTLQTSAVSVPEPSSVSLLFAIGGGLICRRRPRRIERASAK